MIAEAKQAFLYFLQNGALYIALGLIGIIAITLIILFVNCKRKSGKSR